MVSGSEFEILEGSETDTLVGQIVASDPDSQQILSFEIVSGNDSGAFSIDAETGELRVANSQELDYETSPEFQLVVRVSDNGTPSRSAQSLITVRLTDVDESVVPSGTWIGNNIHFQGTPGHDTIYVWTDEHSDTRVWINGEYLDPVTLPANGRVILSTGAGDDQVFACAMTAPVTVFGETGNDRIYGGSADDILDGGEGNDQIHSHDGDDLLIGGEGHDYLNGGLGNDIIVGGDGSDVLEGWQGTDLLIGGLGYDQLRGGSDDDLLIGGTTSFDQDFDALELIMLEWRQPTSAATRTSNLHTGLANGLRLRKGFEAVDDGIIDCLNGENGADVLFAMGLDCFNAPDQLDVIV